MVPEWDSSDMEKLIEEVLLEKLNDRYSKIIKENIGFISLPSERNPRELKRFINNFIVSNEIFCGNKEINPQVLLAIQALKVRWLNFYRNLTGNIEFRKAVEKYTGMDPLFMSKWFAPENNCSTIKEEYNSGNHKDLRYERWHITPSTIKRNRS